MALAIAIILGILALAFVLYPLYRRPKGSETAIMPSRSVEAPYTGEAEAKELAEHEQAARAAIQEVELDYQLGNIEEADYRALRERYMHRALTALKSRYEREQNIDDDIEEQLQKLRESYEKADHE
jgi:hypothetical protein